MGKYTEKNELNKGDIFHVKRPYYYEDDETDEELEERWMANQGGTIREKANEQKQRVVE